MSGFLSCACARANQGRDFGNRAFGLAARIGPAVDGHLRGVLRALAAVDRVVQAPGGNRGADRFFGSLERVEAAVNSAAANRSAPAARAASIAPCAWFISLLGGSAQLAERMVRMSASRRPHEACLTSIRQRSRRRTRANGATSRVNQLP
jgi:hypothetical protein